MLNCKPGQRAIAIGGPVNMGRIATVDTLVENDRPITSQCGKYVAFFHDNNIMSVLFEGQLSYSKYRHNAHWLLDNFFVWTVYTGTGDDTVEHTACFPIMPDAKLRPLLDIEGEDEMVAIAGKPTYKKELETC